MLQVEPTNPYDDSAVSVVKDGTVVGHVLKYVSRIIPSMLGDRFTE